MLMKLLGVFVAVSSVSVAGCGQADASGEAAAVASAELAERRCSNRPDGPNEDRFDEIQGEAVRRLEGTLRGDVRFGVSRRIVAYYQEELGIALPGSAITFVDRVERPIRMELSPHDRSKIAGKLQFQKVLVRLPSGETRTLVEGGSNEVSWVWPNVTFTIQSRATPTEDRDYLGQLVGYSCKYLLQVDRHEGIFYYDEAEIAAHRPGDPPLTAVVSIYGSGHHSYQMPGSNIALAPLP